MKWNRDIIEFDTDPDRIDHARVQAYLQATYWAGDRSAAEIRTSWDHSQVVFGVYDTNADCLQIGCARVVTDTRTFGWLADVFIDPEYRGRGLGKFLVQCVVEHPDCSCLRNFVLGTRDAHGLYEQFGWGIPTFPGRFMIRCSEPPSS